MIDSTIWAIKIVYKTVISAEEIDEMICNFLYLSDFVLENITHASNTKPEQIMLTNIHKKPIPSLYQSIIPGFIIIASVNKENAIQTIDIIRKIFLIIITLLFYSHQSCQFIVTVKQLMLFYE